MTNSKIIDDKWGCLMITKMLNVVDDKKDDLNDNNANTCILAAVDDKKDNLNHNKDNIDDNKDSLNDNNANSCILAGLINPPFTLILSLLGKAASSIVFLTGFFNIQISLCLQCNDTNTTPPVYLYTAEVYPTQVRGLGLALTATAARFFQ